jgi:hypothetical protein
MFERTDRICSKLKLLNNKCKHQVVNQLVLARRECFPKVSMLLRQYCSQITAEQLLWEVRYSTVYFFFSLFIYCGHIINRLKNAKRPHFGHQNRESKTLRNFTNTEVEKESSLRSTSGEQGEACEHSFIDPSATTHTIEPAKSAYNTRIGRYVFILTMVPCTLTTTSHLPFSGKSK